MSVTVSGPVFDGRAEQAATDYVKAVQHEVGQSTLTAVDHTLLGNFRHDSGRYRSTLRTIEDDPRGVVVTDGWPEIDIVYGPWLEGLGSRNSPVTRFPGYWSFRETAAAMQGRAVDIAETILPPYLARMND